MAETLRELWSAAVVARHAGPPFLAETDDGWRPVGWEEAGERVGALAGGFHGLGLRKGDRVAVLSRTRLEWTLCDYALATIGAVIVPIYPTSSSDDVRHVLADSGARALVCEDAAGLEQAEALRAGLPALEHLIVIDGALGALTLPELETAGREAPSLPEEPLSGADVLTFIYTSGTTGPPKGCVLTNRNFVAELDAIAEVPGLFAPGDVVLLFLPLAHNFARMIQYCGARLGLTIAFCADPARLPAALQAVRPTTVPAVPRVFEKVHTSVRAAFEARAGVRRALVERAVSVGRTRAARLERGDRVPLPLALQVWFADRLVFAQVRKRLGGRFRIGISGGAPLGREVAEFFAACGIPILEGYGLSETTSGCCVNRPDRYRFGTVGLPLPGVELALAPDGELLIRGATVFQGYHGRRDETAAALTSDGWLRTGDVGTIDGDGFLSITDRKKELIVTAGGKKIAPAKLEHALKASPYVGQVLIVGDRRPYLVALIGADEEAVARADGRSADELVAEAVAAANARLGRTEQIKRFAVLPRPLELARGELTPTLKVKRRVCEQRFSAELEALYDRGPVGLATP